MIFQRAMNGLSKNLKSVLTENNALEVFGDDYPTHDEACVRD